MSRAYFDTNYLFKLQCEEQGTHEVRALAATVRIVCIASLGRAEFASAAVRKVRERAATKQDVQLALAQIRVDAATGNLRFLPLSDAIIDRLESVFVTAPPATYLRAADAIHLATASENGFIEIYSNDKRLLAAAPLFGLKPVNVIK